MIKSLGASPGFWEYQLRAPPTLWLAVQLIETVSPALTDFDEGDWVRILSAEDPKKHDNFLIKKEVQLFK